MELSVALSLYRYCTRYPAGLEDLGKRERASGVGVGVGVGIFFLAEGWQIRK